MWLRQHQKKESAVTAEQRKRSIAWYRKWTKNGKLLISNISGSNFCMVGHDRRHCSIITPKEFAELVEHGILRKVAGGYQFVSENI
jgi:hypothetical protein